jgi:tetratricopeptide (TPR) repeat protein
MLFEAMARISKDKGNIENFLIYSEAALDIEPNNTQLRFDIAYAYSENNSEELALLHYKKLTDTIKHSIGQNNMGVSYGLLKLKGKAIKCYFEAEKQNETLPMANLAYEYIDAGFTDDAQKLIDKANKLSNTGTQVNPRVGSAQQKIKILIEEENKKEKEILQKAEKQRKFMVRYSKAFCSDKTVSKIGLEGSWKTHWGNLELKFDEKTNIFSINGDMQIEVPNYSSLLSWASLPKSEKVYKDKHVKITGNVENMSGKYSIEVEDKKGSTILIADKTYEATGYLIINENCNQIEIMEKVKDGGTKFIQWEKTTI